MTTDTLLASEDLNLKYYIHSYKARLEYYILGIDMIKCDVIVYAGMCSKVYKVSVYTSTLDECIQEVRYALTNKGLYIVK